MDKNDSHCIRFKPSCVEGVDDVQEVAVFPDRLEFVTPNGAIRHCFEDMAVSQQSVLGRFLSRVCGAKPRPALVADRDWCREPKDRFFIFYTQPPIRVCMPMDERPGFGDSYHRRITELIMSGGYDTFDMA